MAINPQTEMELRRHVMELNAMQQLRQMPNNAYQTAQPFQFPDFGQATQADPNAPQAQPQPQPPTKEDAAQAIITQILTILSKSETLDVEVQSKAVLTLAQAFAQLNPPQQAQGIDPQDQLQLAQEKQAHEQLIQREKLAMDQQKHQQDMQMQQEQHQADLATKAQSQALQADQHNHQKQLQTEKMLMDHEIAKTKAAQAPAQKGE